MLPVLNRRCRDCQPLWLAAGFWSMLLLTLLAYMPGLNGTLIFDDIPNFLPWQNTGDINSLQKVMTFATSGTSMPGRPLSLLSFLVDDQSWSPDIYSLKRTNLAIHLINSSLIFWLCIKLLQHMLPIPVVRQGAFALLAAAIWSLHPLQVSNVSYIIQRMNLLSTLFELVGLLLFIHGREQLDLSPRKALLLCSMAIGLFMPLAVLAKENGLLLCIFALLVETHCFPARKDIVWRLWKAIFLWLPLIAFIGYCLVEFRFFTINYPSRNFDSWERLFTQGPVVADYLNKLLLPRLSGSGLYFDNFPVSRSLIHPISTLGYWILISTLLVLAWHFRHRNKLFSFGIFFYFGGHLMESTLLPLELYFEHRNYLPQLGLWLSLCALLSLANKPRPQKIIALFAFCLIAILSVMTRNNADLWGKPELQTTLWYHDNPGSLRNTLSYANLLLQNGNFAEANKVLANGLKQHPDSLILVISERYVHCYWQNTPVSFSDLPSIAKQADHEYASIVMLEKMRALSTFEKSKPGECQPATAPEIGRIYLGLLENPRYISSRTHSRLYEYLGEIAVGQGHLDDAIKYYDKAFDNSHNPIYPYRQAVLLKSAGQPDMAKDFLMIARKSLGVRQRLQYPDLDSRINELEKQLPSSEPAGAYQP